MRWKRSTGAGVAAAALVVGLGHAVPAQAAPAVPGGPGLHRVTLVTGDQITVTDPRGGSPSFQVKRAKGRERVPFTYHSARNGDLIVAPQDALTLIGQGRVDERLFDITLLTREGYDDTGRTDIPVLAERASTGQQASLAGTTTKASMPTLGIDAIKVDKAKAGSAWASFAGNVKAKGLGGGIAKLWLDGKRRALLDKSVPQIGAPTAWKKGFTGKGTTVAVLDTGYDTGHADLKKVVTKAQGFTDKGAKNVQDKAGHGTHVASIVAGSGTDSKGRYKGVAPGAKIAVGKVLNDEGAGLDSWILAGMEWAATKSGAKVVSMSLGSTDTFGIDPLEKAVGTLTGKTGVLFVLAAGNEGEGGEKTIDSPGSADAALTVGAVDKKDKLAVFSSRGPRINDYAVKPDITAPGVDIVAAWAKGTEAPNPVGKYYQRESGTSMATPHVAGAAAILAQQHPGWKAPQLKAALVGSAKPGRYSEFEQGSGRVDVARAVTQPVVASEGNISAYLRWPLRVPVRRTVTYTNLSGAPITLKLTAPSAPKGLFELSAAELRLPTRGSAAVTVTIAADGVKTGAYSSVLTATAKDVQIRTILGANVEPESYDLGLKVTDRAGNPAPETTTVAYRLDAPGVEYIPVLNGSGKVRLPAGEWNLLTNVVVEVGKRNTAAITDVPVRLDQDQQVVIDARKAKPLKTTIDDPNAALAADIWTGVVHDNGRTHYNWGGSWADAESDLSITPLDQRSLTFFEHTTWTDKRTLDKTAFRYDLVNWRTGGIPADPSYQAKRAELAKITAAWRAQGKKGTYGSALVAPVVDFGGGQTDAFLKDTPTLVPRTVTQYFTVNPGITWRRGYIAPSGQTILGPDHKLAKASTKEVWGTAVQGPAFARRSAVRNGDVITHEPWWLYADSAPGRVGYGSDPEGTVALSTGGKVLKSAKIVNGKVLSVKVPVANATYTLKSSVKRDQYDSTLSTKIDTVWTFKSGHTTKEQPLPLQVVRFAPAKLDDWNRAKGGSSTDVAVRVERNTGIGIEAAGKAPVIEVSFNDGKTWKKVAVKPSGAQWKINIRNPKSGYVSLRATIPGALSQTIIHAYAIGG